ncbi:Uncharacterised protein [Bordetella pertussis]|nr:Uncharacterised protein [Bordetella pertussis]CFO25667.1 Uncharacterised protein [Bordetella pertussis]CFT87874.1 Uncharacterised protein [Bordetella pertussis]CFV95293.1 Uncharacterised protein [Bordetella pertussis]CPH71344.1 Uncharacterised protein [Bordetella pertussis]
MVSSSSFPRASRASASTRASSVSTAPLPSSTPGSPDRKISFSARRATATLVARSSMARLKASPVGEKPSGESSTTEPCSMANLSASTSILRTWPVCL